MGKRIRNEEETEIVIASVGFNRFWKRVSEWTTSSLSSKHYDHYKVSIKNGMSSRIHAQKVTVITRSGVSPELDGVSHLKFCWETAGLCLAGKLRYIPLYEAGFNLSNSLLIFRNEAMTTLTENGLIPNEQFRKRLDTK